MSGRSSPLVTFDGSTDDDVPLSVGTVRGRHNKSATLETGKANLLGCDSHVCTITLSPLQRSHLAERC
jgi:hypothetical protein